MLGQSEENTVEAFTESSPFYVVARRTHLKLIPRLGAE